MIESIKNLEIIQYQPENGSYYPFPLLFIHGAMQSAAVWEDQWLPFFSQRGYAVYAVSLRGHGKSMGDYKQASCHDYINDCLAVADALAEKPVLIGHSMGGFLVQHLICRASYPGAVLISSIPHDGMGLSTSSVPVIPNLLPSLKAMLTDDMKVYNKSSKLIRRYFFSRSTPEETIRRYLETATGEKYTLCNGEMSTKNTSGHPDPSASTTPVLVLTGEEDYTFRYNDQKRIADAYRGKFEFISAPGAGHYLMMDVKWREAAEAVDGWLKTLNT